MGSLVGFVTAVTSATVGPVVSTMNDVSVSVLLTFAAESVTVTVQLSKVPSLKSLRVMIVYPLFAADVVEEQALVPPYVIVPASLEERVKLGLKSEVGVVTAVNSATVGAVVSTTKDVIASTLLTLLTLSVTVMVQLL